MNLRPEILGIDPRCLSSAKLHAPAPLPYVSRRALKRVRDRIEAPSTCHCCSGHVRLISNAEIYGREYGEWPYAYLCDACGAYVGLHPDTDLPLGTLADHATREARKDAKAAFYRLIKVKHSNDRTAGYMRLAELMAIPKQACHFGLFDVDQCGEALRHIVADLARKAA